MLCSSAESDYKVKASAMKRSKEGQREGPGLNQAQEEAVKHQAGPLLVLAGAGSGKTRVVIERIAFLIEEQQIRPGAIAAMTFTNKAAKEMQERLQRRLSRRLLGKERPWIGTFHSFGLRLLKRFAPRLGMEREFVIYDAEDTQKLLKQLDPKESKERLKERGRLISSAKNLGLVSQELNESTLKATRGAQTLLDETASLSELQQQMERYEEAMRRAGALDFDDLLLLALRLMQRDCEAAKQIQEEIHYLLIDEYQDTNTCQYLLAGAIAAQRGEIFAVGDPDQSIYSWRGANIGNILRFEEDFPGAKILRLECNYRSTSPILEASNALIAHNQARLPKKLYSLQEGGETPSLFLCEDGLHEAQTIVKSIQEQIEQGRSPSEIAILYRTNFQSRPFEDLLISAQIPYVIVGGLSFYQRKEIKDLLALLRLLFFPQDLVSFTRMINIPKRGIGPKALERLDEVAKREGRSYRACCERLTPKEMGITSRAHQGLMRFFELLTELEKEAQKEDLAMLVQRAIERSCYVDYLRETQEQAQEREENLNELVAKAQQWQEMHPQEELRQFFLEITLAGAHDLKKDFQGEGAIELMTAHHSKGLEYQVVYVVGLEEQLFPHVYSKLEEPQVEEERRLLYVAMTRARERLLMSCCRRRFLWGNWRQMRPSRFLFEIPDLAQEATIAPRDCAPLLY